MSSNEPLPSPSHDPRIEQLLLAGLDRYFAGEFERAIQVWSRVFFLDRGHPRARAYIDRARGALAERQREAEARLQRADGGAGSAPDPGATGTTRFGELSAPDLAAESAGGRLVPAVTSAPFVRAPVAADAGHSVTSRTAHARVVVDVEALDGQPRLVAGGGSEPRVHPRDAVGGRARWWRERSITQAPLVGLAALLLFGAGYVVAARDRLATWWATPNAPALSVPVMAPEVATEPRGTEQILERARQYLAQGQHRAALRVLSAVAADDPLRAPADRLRAEAERALRDREAVDGRQPAGSPRQGSASR